MLKTLIAAAIVLGGFASTANALPVSLFEDGTFVGSDEAANQSASLTALGHTVTGFTGTTDAAWSTAMTGASALVVAEQESSGVLGSLSAATLLNIANYVSGGGSFVVTGSYYTTSDPRGLDLINAIFGRAWAIGGDTASGSFALDAAAAAGTNFADDPATLANQSGTSLVSIASLVSGERAIYNDGVNASVVSFGFGSGTVSYLGYDWFGTPSADWDTVLASAIGTSLAPVPIPAALPLLLGALGAFGGFAVRRRKSAAS